MKTKYYKSGDGGEKMRNRSLGPSSGMNEMKVRLINCLEKQPGHVQLCLVLAFSTLLISLFLDRRDLTKTVLFYVITAGGCTLCDWKGKVDLEDVSVTFVLLCLIITSCM